ncbi:hypothetical protein [Hymenobacter sp. B81]|uniref:hypothetical protein n=1 Tax=Hymenobacter sp. B81 TaxID=3344878 RepID=UPI0037DD6810
MQSNRNQLAEILILLLAAAALLAGYWWIFRYESCETQRYPLGNCGLQIESSVCWEIGQRRLVLALRDSPNSGAAPLATIAKPLDSGFDAYFECVVVCTDHGVTVYHLSDSFPQPASSARLTIQKLNDPYEYSRIQHFDGAVVLRIY